MLPPAASAMNLVNSSEPSAPFTPGTPAVPITTETNFSQYLKEGYLSYLAPAGKGLQIDVGKFVTNAGAEVIETKDNWNYSRGLLFSWAIPYFHFGVRAKYTFNSKASLTGFLLNGWNNSVDNNSGKTTGFTLALNPTKKLGLIENYYVGPEQANDNSDFRHLTDTVVTYNPTAKLSLMAQMLLRARAIINSILTFVLGSPIQRRHVKYRCGRMTRQKFF